MNENGNFHFTGDTFRYYQYELKKLRKMQNVVVAFGLLTGNSK